MKEEKFPHTRKPLHWQRQGVGMREASAPRRRAATGMRRAKRRDSRTEDQGNHHSPAREACLLTRGGRAEWELRLGHRR